MKERVTPPLPPAIPHAVVDVGGATRYTYDANGNMTTRWSTQFNGWQTLTWDHENRQW